MTRGIPRQCAADTDRSGVFDIVSVGFSPVKGMRHITQAGLVCDGAGPVGDRRFCLVDVAQRRVLRTVQHPSLIAVVAVLRGDELELTLPDGRSVCAVAEPTGPTLTCDYWKRAVDLRLTHGPHAELLSAWLGRPVRLAVAQPGAVVYGPAISIVTTGSLADLARRIDRPRLIAEAARWRATLLVDTDGPYIEDSWRGREMLVEGSSLIDAHRADAGLAEANPNSLRIRIGAPVPRCAVIDIDPVTGERNTRLLKALVDRRPRNDAGEPMFGVYAEIV